MNIRLAGVMVAGVVILAGCGSAAATASPVNAQVCANFATQQRQIRYGEPNASLIAMLRQVVTDLARDQAAATGQLRTLLTVDLHDARALDGKGNGAAITAYCRATYGS